MSDLSEFRTNLPATADFIDVARPGNVAAIISRIEDAVEEETAAIRTDIHFDIKASNARKSRYLYELTRATKGLVEGDYPSELKVGVERLRDKLVANERAILAHLSAVSEVASLLRDAIQRSEADGTYSANEFGWAR
ncbi:hypothetical protein EDC40_102233 [Aminobacter aminovorans]|jgi:hypothetical protein|uniref:Flagellar protein FlgN n=1 Tax=Aminobacter aminovorans TaxID=83263 RepID=A0A380WK60_AMIAI|nr:hypothetical protein [Aminobacter aminovorans]TCS28792.1 hypothetical protein EDC40_102233 [Aminobacter aminovorans]SUU88646.1 Uncharacterised protein [Aminobacter aminovorans]